MSKYKRLTLNQRYLIFGYLAANISNIEIAILIGKDPTTIGREIKRNSINGKYEPEKAEKLADFRKRNSHKQTKITEEMEETITDMLETNQTSPEGISGWCKENKVNMVTFPRIYEFIKTDKNSGGTLYQHLRRGNKKIKPHGSIEKRGQIKNRVSIDERPAIVNEKNRIGDLEGDTVIGADNKGVIITIADRSSMTVFIIKVPSRHAKIVADAIIKTLKPFAPYLHTITFDNGKEFADHERIARELGIKVYFAHPYKSCERGLNENLNGQIRQYLPKKTNFENVTDDKIQEIIYKLNTRPRKTLGFSCPAAVFDRGLNR